MNILSIIAFQVTPGVENLSAGKDNDLFIWIAMAAGILALGLGIYLFTLISSLKKNDNNGISNGHTSERNIAVNAKTDEDAEARLEQRLGELEQRLYALENPGRVKEWSSEEIAAVKTTGAANRTSGVSNQGSGKSSVPAEGKSPGERTTEGKSVNEKLGENRLREEKRVKNEFTEGKSADNRLAGENPSGIDQASIRKSGVEQPGVDRDGKSSSVERGLTDSDLEKSGSGDRKSGDSGLADGEWGNRGFGETEQGKEVPRGSGLENIGLREPQPGVKQADGRLSGENLTDKNALQGKLFDANQPAAKAPAEKLPEVKLPEIQLLFAKLPDIENGFSADVLSPVQDGEQVYEIKVKDDQGTYEISQTTDAQKYALSDANYYLLGACDFQNQPSKDSKINTKRIGKLIKSGTQWIIQERASIEFI